MTTHLRIDFQVREVCEDGSVPKESLRYVTFGDDVSPVDIKDFFERCGIATDLMFKGRSLPKVLTFNARPAQIIPAIKALRQMTGLGLKEAKDRCEAPPGTAVVYFVDGKDAEATIEHLRRDGVFEAVITNAKPDEMFASGVPQFVKGSY